MSDSIKLPKLDYSEILETGKALHSYSKLVGAVRAAMTPEQKDYWHISLRVAPQGFRTTPIPTPDGRTFEILLNLVSHSAIITTSTGLDVKLPLNGQSIYNFSRDILSALDSMKINPVIDLEKYEDKSHLTYIPEVAGDIFRSYSIIDVIFKEFKGGLTQETSPVQLWPHHMDIAFTCYTAAGLIEQIGFGYLTGDEAIEEPYLYITAYPELEDYRGIELVDKAYWHTEGWQGVVLKYSDLARENNPREILLEHLQKTFDQMITRVQNARC